MSESSPLASMLSLVDSRVRTWRFGVSWEDTIGLAFLDVRLISIDLFESCVAVDGHAIWSDSDEWS